jgi:kynurenine formamidase
MDIRELGRELSNWGRWGAEDERGTLNLITPEHVVRAASLVRSGRVFDLGISFDADGPMQGPRRVNPIRLMSETGDEQIGPGAFRYADDWVIMPLQAASQWDALAHVHYDGQLYNGFSTDTLTVKGAARCGIEKYAPGITGRGVLLDVARHRGEDWLPAGYRIEADELDAVSRAAGVEVGVGDILLIRTGYRRMFAQTGDRAAFLGVQQPGLALSCLRWLRERDVAAVCSDNQGVEVTPGEVEEHRYPFHMVAIRDMGLALGEIFDLEGLGEDCAADGRWEFFFSGPVLKFTRGAGCPVSPLAVK